MLELFGKTRWWRDDSEKLDFLFCFLRIVLKQCFFAELVITLKVFLQCLG